MSDWLRRERKEQMFEDLADIATWLAKAFWRFVQRSYHEAHQEPTQHQQPPPQPPQHG